MKFLGVIIVSAITAFLVVCYLEGVAPLEILFSS